MFHFPTEEGTRRPLIDRCFAYLERLSESDSLLVKLALFALFVSTLWVIASIALGWRTEVAVSGGTFREGIIGTPRFINPVLAVTRADRDLTELVYDGIMTLGSDGVLVPNLAESVTISDDGLTYNVILRRDVLFHDGAPFTARDVVFTVGKITDPVIASPLRPNFDGVVIEQVSEYEINFVLEAPYAPFIENLTFGILPEHIWGNVLNDQFSFSQRNSEPIGTGPYAVEKIVRSASGIPETYELKAHEGYHKGIPKIATLVLSFYATEEKLIDAFLTKRIGALAGIDPSRLFELGIDAHTHTLIESPLPRTFALYINQNKSTALRDRGAREALSAAIDRTSLTETVLGGYGIPLYGPLPHGFGITADQGADVSGDTIERARDILRDSGWKFNTDTGVWEKEIDSANTILELSISTVNNPRFEATAEFIRSAWERLGVRVTVKQFEQSDLTQGIIRPRDYEILLFGAQVGRSLDYYSFWHSSQRNDPGLNVALYANITTDAQLSEARTTTDITKRNDALIRFSEEIKTETPAIFLYQPTFIYIFPNVVTGAHFSGLGEPHERFASVHDWYIDTESIWSFLAPQSE